MENPEPAEPVESRAWVGATQTGTVLCPAILPDLGSRNREVVLSVAPGLQSEAQVEPAPELAALGKLVVNGARMGRE